MRPILPLHPTALASVPKVTIERLSHKDAPADTALPLELIEKQIEVRTDCDVEPRRPRPLRPVAKSRAATNVAFYLLDVDAGSLEQSAPRSSRVLALPRLARLELSVLGPLDERVFGVLVLVSHRAHFPVSPSKPTLKRVLSRNRIT
jgi:hypothetical protein